jgi:hypothetical protein
MLCKILLLILHDNSRDYELLLCMHHACIYIMHYSIHKEQLQGNYNIHIHSAQESIITHTGSIIYSSSKHKELIDAIITTFIANIILIKIFRVSSI